MRASIRARHAARQNKKAARFGRLFLRVAFCRGGPVFEHGAGTDSGVSRRLFASRVATQGLCDRADVVAHQLQIGGGCALRAA